MWNLFKRRPPVIERIVIGIAQDGIMVTSITHTDDALPVVKSLRFMPGERSMLSAQLVKLAHDLEKNTGQYTTLLSTGEYQLLTLEAPNVPADEMKAAIRWRVKDLIDFHIDEAEIALMDISADPGVETRGNLLFAVVTNIQTVEQRQQAFALADMTLAIIDIPEMAQRNISALLELPEHGLALLSFDSGGGLFTVTFRGELYVSRRIDVTAGQLIHDDQDQRESVFQRITLELQRSLDHCNRQFHFIAIDRLVLAPVNDPAARFLAYLTTAIYLPVESLDLARLLNFSEVPTLQSIATQQRFFLTLGAALRVEEKAA